MVVLSTLLVTMCVNLLLMPSSVTQEASCNETYASTIECTGEAVEPGLWNTIIMAGITTPLVTILVGFFKHLRQPLMDSVEPKLSIVALGPTKVVIILLNELLCKCCLCRSGNSVRADMVKFDADQVIGAATHAKSSAASEVRSIRRRSITALQSFQPGRSTETGTNARAKAAPIHRCGLQITALEGRNFRKTPWKIQPFLRMSVITSYEIVTRVSTRAETIETLGSEEQKSSTTCCS
eukprot:COSAG02_NODE_2062_length_9971_cov_5.016106_6_plen_238_part_00